MKCWNKIRLDENTFWIILRKKEFNWQIIYHISKNKKQGINKNITFSLKPVFLKIKIFFLFKTVSILFTFFRFKKFKGNWTWFSVRTIKIFCLYFYHYSYIFSYCTKIIYSKMKFLQKNYIRCKVRRKVLFNLLFTKTLKCVNF